MLALWPEGTSNATLRAASRNVRFQLGQADKFRAGLIRAGQWRAHIEQVLAGEGVPRELVALPHVESSFNPRAYSHVGAAGLWQFMRSTGRRYMRVDDVVDERMDPHKASVAAARLLGYNYRQIDSWPLAITAYNHGLAGMMRAVRTLGTRDIAAIVSRYQSRSFGFASRNFYAEFLAASEIDHDPEPLLRPAGDRCPSSSTTSCGSITTTRPRACSARSESISRRCASTIWRCVRRCGAAPSTCRAATSCACRSRT